MNYVDVYDFNCKIPDKCIDWCHYNLCELNGIELAFLKDRKDIILNKLISYVD